MSPPSPTSLPLSSSSSPRSSVPISSSSSSASSSSPLPPPSTPQPPVSSSSSFSSSSPSMSSPSSSSSPHDDNVLLISPRLSSTSNTPLSSSSSSSQGKAKRKSKTNSTSQSSSSPFAASLSSSSSYQQSIDSLPPLSIDNNNFNTKNNSFSNSSFRSSHHNADDFDSSHLPLTPSLHSPSFSPSPSPHSPLSPSSTAYLFKYIILTQIIVYIEAGAVPAILNELRIAFNMSFLLQGALGGVVYLFLSFTCPLAGYLVKIFHVKSIMSMSLAINAISTLLFAITPTGYVSLLIIARAMIGVSQAFLMVYSPIWVDEHAPNTKRTRWMSYIQSSVPIGIMLGYGIATSFLLFNTCGEWLSCWRFPFILQGILTIPLAIGCYCVPTHHMDIQRRKKHRVACFVVGGEEGEYGFGANELSRAMMFPQPIMIDEEVEGEGHDEGEGEEMDEEMGQSNDDNESGSEKKESSSETSSLLPPSSYSSFATSSTSIIPSQKSIPIASYDAESPIWSSTSPSSSPLGLSSSSSSSFSSRHPPSSHHQLRSTFHPSRHPHHAPLSMLSSPSHSLPIPSTFFHRCHRLSHNSIFLFVCLSLSGLYFVVTGLQFWVTDYLITTLGSPPHQVRILFIFTAATSPVLGVLFGGWFVDKEGGYSGKYQRLHAISLCILFGVLGFLFTIPVTLLSSLYPIFIFIWLLLFFGGCVLPAATGIMIQSVHMEMRPFASSFSVILFNLCGYFASPVISGMVMNVTDSMLWGIRVILWMGIIPIICMMMAQREAWRKANYVEEKGEMRRVAKWEREEMGKEERRREGKEKGAGERASQSISSGMDIPLSSSSISSSSSSSSSSTLLSSSVSPPSSANYPVQQVL